MAEKKTSSKTKTGTKSTAAKKPSTPKKPASKATAKKTAKTTAKNSAVNSKKVPKKKTTVKSAAETKTVKSGSTKASSSKTPAKKTPANRTPVAKAPVKKTSAPVVKKTTTGTTARKTAAPKRKATAARKTTGTPAGTPAAKASIRKPRVESAGSNANERKEAEPKEHDFTPPPQSTTASRAPRGTPAALLNDKLKSEGFYASGNDLALSMNGKKFTFSWKTGTVVGTRHDRKTEISGGGGTIQGSVYNGTGTVSGTIDPITTTNTEIISFFLKDPVTSVEKPYTIYNNDVPLRDGQTMTVASIHHDGKSSIISFCNVSSRRWNLAMDAINVAENLGLGKSIHMKASYRKALFTLFAAGLPILASIGYQMSGATSYDGFIPVIAIACAIGIVLYFMKKAQLKAKYAWLVPFNKKLCVVSAQLC